MKSNSWRTLRGSLYTFLARRLWPSVHEVYTRNRPAKCACRKAGRCIIVVMDLRPLHDRVLVTRLDEVEQKIGGIIIPDSAKEKPQQAEVHAVGNGKLLETGERVPLEVKPGDRILFGKYSGSEIKIDGREYLILKEDEILGVLE